LRDIEDGENNILFIGIICALQGCGSGLIQSGSGSRNLAQSGYGSGSTTVPYVRRQIFSKIKKSTKKKILAVFTIFVPFRYENK
jgi:hypothetical protein